MKNLTEYDKIYIPFDFERNSFNKISKKLKSYVNLEEITSENLIRVETKNYVGLIRIGNINLIINPKIGPINYLKILKEIKSPQIHFFDFVIKHKGTITTDEYLSLFLSTFLDMIDLLCKRNYRKQYRRTIEKRMNIRGKILFKKQIEKCPYSFYKFYCEFDIYTFNNIFNQIIKYTLFICSKIIRNLSSTILRKFKRIYHYFGSVSLKKINSQTFSAVNYDLNTRDYQKIHQICKLIINHLNFYEKTGEETFFTFLFDMNKAFESYLQHILNKYSKYQVKGQPRQEFLDLDNLRPIRPDIRIFENDKIIHIADVKYKKKIKREDFWQIIVYCGHFNVKFSSLICIEAPEEKITLLRVPMFKTNVKINVLKFNIANFDEMYLKDFVSKFDNVAKA